jgi:hypothetical protein
MKSTVKSTAAGDTSSHYCTVNFKNGVVISDDNYDNNHNNDTLFNYPSATEINLKKTDEYDPTYFQYIRRNNLENVNVSSKNCKIVSYRIIIIFAFTLQGTSQTAIIGLSIQTEITEESRCYVINMLRCLHTELNKRKCKGQKQCVSEKSFFLAIHILDGSLRVRKVLASEFELWGYLCLSFAMKLQEVS